MLGLLVWCVCRRLAEEAEDAADLEEKRKYLGGEAEHSILVKGQVRLSLSFSVFVDKSGVQEGS